MARTRRRGRTAATGGDGNGGQLPPLDRERIVCAASALLEEAGLEGLSMRRLASRLGITAATLYWYLRGKDELLHLIADAISGEIQEPDAALPWRARLEMHLGEYRRVLHAHRDAARVLAETLPTGARRLRQIDLALEALLDAGFAGLTAVRAARLLNDYVTGFVMEEAIQATRFAGVQAQDIAEGAADATLSIFAPAAAARYPSIAALAAELADHDDDERFRFGLAALLDGLELRLTRPRGEHDA
jgi:TetR/AcrR family tetracycline transcriptional repressor